MQKSENRKMANLLCPECGYEFNDNLPSCPECGCPANLCINETSPNRPESVKATPVAQEVRSTPIPAPSHSQSDGLQHCRECGAPISFDAKHCPHCGAKGLYAPLDFGNSIYDCFCRKYALFSGRSRRSEVFPFLICVVGLSVLLSFGYPELGTIVLLITLIPWFAAIARRLHDIGRNGWWAICPIIPWIFIFRDSDKETNEYGISPKYDPNYVVEELPDRGSEIAMWCLIAIVIGFVLLFFVFAGIIGGILFMSNGY